MVGHKQKKRAVKDEVERGLCSLWRACVYLSFSWSTFNYRCICALLVKEGWTTSRKFAQEIRRSEGLQVKPPKKRRYRQGIYTGPPAKANGRNHVWSWDFVHDRTDNGGKLKMMTLIDVPRS